MIFKSGSRETVANRIVRENKARAANVGKESENQMEPKLAAIYGV